MTADDDESEAQSSEEESSDNDLSGQEAPAEEGGTKRSSGTSAVSVVWSTRPHRSIDTPWTTTLYLYSLSPYAAEEPEDSLPAHRLEDLSEDDFDGGAASDDSDVERMQEKLAEQKRCCTDTPERAMPNLCPPANACTAVQSCLPFMRTYRQASNTAGQRSVRTHGRQVMRYCSSPS